MKIKYIGISAAFFSLSLLSYTATSAQVNGNLNSQKIIELTNTDRKAQRLPELSYNEKLSLAASLKLDDMIANNYFDHVSPQGVSPWYFFRKADYSYESAGENLALNFSDPGKVEQAWMASPEHRQNILNPKFTEMGLAEKEVEYQGQRTNFIVEYLGSPQNSPELAARP